MNTKHLKTKIYVLKEVNKTLSNKRREYDSQIERNETVIREAEQVLDDIKEKL